MPMENGIGPFLCLHDSYLYLMRLRIDRDRLSMVRFDDKYVINAQDAWN